MNKNYYAIIMAGGVGSRFWPLSTAAFPKQFHDMLGTGQTLIQKTFGRLSRFVPEENILVLTNERYRQLVTEQLPRVAPHRILLEPAMRNTAPCILYAALKLRKENPDALMVVAPSDHWIADEAAFEQDVLQCFTACERQDVLLTLGIPPAFPHTGYGYIHFKKEGNTLLMPVIKFTEKPDYETAKSFLGQGDFLWNAGIFIWSAASITAAFERFQPEMYRLFHKGLEVYNTDREAVFIQENYAAAENISVDYAIMEKAGNVYVLPAGFDWNDLGSWGSLYDKLQKDEYNNAVVNADVFAANASGNMIRTAKDKLVVIDGLQDYIIVDKANVLFIYPKAKEQQ
ncbi:MAG: mannose-1-phosphate guanylyltransferase, partial [Sinomicrobium sp.]|nr:mannose-1-phosphate guanylyltransferase [Sinomicrobium sp.]